MTIKKQLYLSFGIILAMVLVLLAVNMLAVRREHEAKAGAQRSIDMTEVTSTVRFQMMQNRLHLQNYLPCITRRNWRIPSNSATAWKKCRVWNKDGPTSLPTRWWTSAGA